MDFSHHFSFRESRVSLHWNGIPVTKEEATCPDLHHPTFTRWVTSSFCPQARLHLEERKKLVNHNYYTETFLCWIKRKNTPPPPPPTHLHVHKFYACVLTILQTQSVYEYTALQPRKENMKIIADAWNCLCVNVCGVRGVFELLVFSLFNQLIG